MIEIEIVNVDLNVAREYFCPDCESFRLCVAGAPDGCGKCGNKFGLVVGKIGELDIEALIAANKD